MGHISILDTYIDTVRQASMNLGSRIALLRKRTGLNQVEFAQHLGISQSAFKNYERGASEPSVSLVTRLCDEFKASADWLVLGVGADSSKTLYDELERAVVKVRRWAEAFPVPVPPEKEAQMVSVLLRYRLENENPSEAMEQFILDKAA
jgi:transcriptional regulator with XRE-family HTH domain